MFPNQHQRINPIFSSSEARNRHASYIHHLNINQAAPIEPLGRINLSIEHIDSDNMEYMGNPMKRDRSVQLGKIRAHAIQQLSDAKS